MGHEKQRSGRDLSVTVLGFHHITLLTRDIERGAAFYDGVLGQRRKERPNFSARDIWYEVGG
jgi:catechol 2,3-dioxygenase-like lactoylglutathione lyase family enzyme